jgi:L-asparaginase
MRSEVAYVKACLGVGLALRGEELTEFLCRRHVAGEFIES